MTRSRRRRRRQNLTQDQVEQNRHRKLVRDVFGGLGFKRIAGVVGAEVQISEQATEFDDIFVFENILVVSEYTCASSSNIGDHIRKKKTIYDLSESDERGLISQLISLFPNLSTSSLAKYSLDNVILRFVYASRNDVKQALKSSISKPIYLDYPQLRYFSSTVRLIQRSGRYEFFDFLGITADHIGQDGVISGSMNDSRKYRGLLLPETNSNFPQGFKILAFYASPADLLRRCYVLRRSSWHDNSRVYQRLIEPKKIRSIRRYLTAEKRVFVNNIIASLPTSTRILDDDGNTVSPSSISVTTPVTLMLPDSVNSVGIIDGQHRVYSYFESGADDPEIVQKRGQQNLLVTGILYPQSMSEPNKTVFEARLFNEINSTQLSASTEHKQIIGMMLNPTDQLSIATRVLFSLDGSSGPIGGMIQRYFFESDKLKPSSIISFGVRPLIKAGGADSLFSIWPEKDIWAQNTPPDPELVDRYIEFCVDEINQLIDGFKYHIPNERWTSAKKVDNYFLKTVTVNGMLICLRMLIERKLNGDRGYYIDKLSGIEDFDFKSFGSSRYRLLAERIVDKFFS